MKKTKIYLLTALACTTLMASCGNSYEKSPEDWSMEVCKCASENGVDAAECQDLLNELKDYYAEEDYDQHDKATTLIGQDCPEVLLVDE